LNLIKDVYGSGRAGRCELGLPLEAGGDPAQVGGGRGGDQEDRGGVHEGLQGEAVPRREEERERDGPAGVQPHERRRLRLQARRARPRQAGRRRVQGQRREANRVHHQGDRTHGQTRRGLPEQSRRKKE